MSTTRIGVGTSSPTSTFQVNGTTSLNGQFDVINGGANFRVTSESTSYVALKYNASTWASFNANDSYFQGTQFYFQSGLNFRFAGSGSFGFTGNPLARLLVKGSGSTSATTALLVQNSSSTSALQIKDDLTSTFSGVSYFNARMNVNQGIQNESSANVQIFVVNNELELISNNPNNGSGSLRTTGQITTTDSQTKSIINVNNLVPSTSASFNTLNGFAFTSTITQTTGTIRGLFINPTLNASTDFRAIETTRGDVLFGTTSGLVGIGSITSGWRLNVDGAIRAQRIDLTGSAGPGHVMLRIDDNGTVMRNNTFNINSGNGNAGQSANLAVGNTDTTVARLYVKGSGSTSATTALLVQNSGGNTSLEILDDRKSTFRGVVNVTPPTITGGSEFFRVQSGNGYSALITGFENGTLGLGAGGGLIGYGNSNFSYVVGSNFILNYVPTNNTNTYGISISTGFTNNGAGGTSEGTMLRFLGSTATAVGNVTLNQIEVKNTINNTGGTTINRGFYYAPTVTSVVNTQNIAFQSTSGSVNINTSTIQASAILQADSTTQGFLPPRVTTIQKNAIASPATGLMVFDTDLVRPCFFNGATWITL
jgi:hypothetical protein